MVDTLKNKARKRSQSNEKKFRKALEKGA